MNPTTVVIGGVGALLIYSAVKGTDPRDVIASALGQSRDKGKGGKSTAGARNTAGGGLDDAAYARAAGLPYSGSN